MQKHSDDHKTTLAEILGRIFLAQSGSFFINYIVTTTLTGNFLELLRLGDRWRSFQAVSEREIQEPHSKTAAPFAYGMQYSWVLVIFATVLAFSSFIPLILPFGFAHFALKYLVDKYNLLYVCPKDREGDGKILHMSLNYVIFCVVFCQVLLAFFFLLKGHFLQTSLVLGTSICSLSIYLFYTYRRKNFRRKRRRQIESMYRNRQGIEGLDGGSVDLLHDYLGSYRPPLMQDPHWGPTSLVRKSHLSFADEESPLLTSN